MEAFGLRNSGELPDLGPMVRRAAMSAVIGFATKVTMIWRTAESVHAHRVVRHWHGVPFVGFAVQRATFTRITSSSTVVLGFVVVGIVTLAVVRTTDQVRTAGWLFAAVGLYSTLLVDLVLHRIQRPYTDPTRLRWAVGAAVLSTVIVGLWIAFERPTLLLSRPRDAAGLTQRPLTWSIVLVAAATCAAVLLLAMTAWALTGRPAPVAANIPAGRVGV
jgi:hypothetical protein